MPKIIEYKTIAGQDAQSFERAVNTMIGDGWQPIGGPVQLVSNFGAVMVQALVKYAPLVVV